MRETALLQKIGQKEISKELIAERVAGDPELVSEVLKGLSAEKADIKYGCARVLRIISEKEPEILYPGIDLFIGSDRKSVV